MHGCVVRRMVSRVASSRARAASKDAHAAASPGAWALFRRVDVAGATRLRLRVQPVAGGLRVVLALGEPANVVATFDADAAGAAVGTMAVFEVPLAEPLTVVGGLIFLLPSAACLIDWFMLP